ncbi:MAG: YmdB family metallophosphoesterase, partial [Acholeplasmataceae bacterium]
HTHIQTADERVLPKGTIYITDVGMTGPLNGIIGVRKDIVINRFLNGYTIPNEVEEGVVQLNGVIIDLDFKTIQRIHLES